MANNAQFSGIQMLENLTSLIEFGQGIFPEELRTDGLPLRPPAAPMGPQSTHPSIPMQFRAAVPPQLPLPYVPMASQQFLPVGRPNVGPSSQSQQLQFSQPMQHLPARPGPLGHSMTPPPPPLPQAFQVPDFQPIRPVISVSPQTQHAVQMPNNYMPGLSGHRIDHSLSYNLPAPSTGQTHINEESTSQYQPTSVTNIPSFPQGGSAWSSDSQTTKTVQPVLQPAEQMSVAPSVPVTSEQRETAEKAPSDWIEHTSRTGKRYYYNKKTKLSSWEKPLDLMTAIERADASTDWKEYTAPDGRKYFYNKVTRQSKWMIPDEVKLAREQLRKCTTEEQESTKDPNNEASVPSVTSSTSNVNRPSSSSREAVSSPVPVAPVIADVKSVDVVTAELSMVPIESSTVAINAAEGQAPLETTPINVVASIETTVPVTLPDLATQSMRHSEDVVAKYALSAEDVTSVSDVEETKKGIVTPQKANVAAVEEINFDQETVVHENKLEAKTAFRSLLESANIASDWTWDQAMRVIINDRRYGALRTLGERKQAFNEFLGQKKKQEAEERRSKQKKAREEFKQMLEESKEIISSTKWSKAVAIFEDDDRFKAVERSKDREDLFEDHLVELEKKERAKALEEHKRYKMEYIEFLKSCDFITVNSQWRKVQDRLEADQRCSRLEKIDRLEIFQEYLRDLEKEEEEQRKLRMEESRKRERKNRDEFRKLMEAHVSSGTLTSKTHWRDYCIKVKDLPAYLAVSSNTSGATPKDLFEDVTEELEKQYIEDKDRIKGAVKIKKVSMSSTWTLEDLKDAIAEDIISPPVSDVNLKLVFDELQERVREREEKEAKRRKRLADDFYGSLNISKEITSSSRWDDFKPVFEDRQDSWFTVEESFFREIFDKYIAELKEARDERKHREDKAKENVDGKDRDRRKDKSRREKDRSKKNKSKKDETDSDNGDDAYIHEENRRSGREKEKKRQKRHQSSLDDMSLDEKDTDRSKKSHRHSVERKKTKQTEQQAFTSVEYESRHKRYKRDHGNGSHRHGDYEDQKEREYGEDGEVW